MTAMARVARTSVDKLSLMATTYDVNIERIAESSKRVYRFVKKLDQLRARQAARTRRENPKSRRLPSRSPPRE